MNNEYWMREALKEARVAKEKEEVPVGAVVILNDRIIGRGHNQVERLKDPTAHAELIAITSAANTLNNWRLDNATLYVTVEPCPMCAGAILLARISRCVFGISDPRVGSLGTVYNIKSPELEVISGVLEPNCKHILKGFFDNLRKEDTH
ncbi:MAG: tRNA adenosine(34) deaminase TadA [bacterium]|nr:tRNA adenosine(34) deaminase TadA [bacterium]